MKTTFFKSITPELKEAKRLVGVLKTKKAAGWQPLLFYKNLLLFFHICLIKYIFSTQE